MKSILHTAQSRGGAQDAIQHGWLQTHHTFSFNHYYDKERMGFGALRVLNDDVIGPGGGFGMHPHDNMEIITIALEGDLEHKDSMGNVGVVRRTDEKTDVQVMSAGTGIVHSEYNKSALVPVKLLQIWITPSERDVKPRYEQISVDRTDYKGKLREIVSPEGHDAPLWIHQNAWLYLALLEKGHRVQHKVKSVDNGIYIFVVSGSVEVGEHVLNARDGLGLFDFDGDSETVHVVAHTTAEVILFDVPMK